MYLSANVIPDRLLFYVDEQVAPGSALNREAWGMLWSADHTWYLKAGQMYLPFGLRLQDQSAFVNRSATSTCRRRTTASRSARSTGTGTRSSP